MRIDLLALDNITCFEQATFHYPKKITVIVAGNGDGKTTQVDAITYGLIKQSGRTDKGGGGAKRMVRTGAKQGSITMSVSSNGAEHLVLDRSIPGDLTIEGQHGNTTQLQANLEDYIGTSAQVIAAALSSSQLLEMKPSEQKSLLFGLLGLSFEREEIIERVIQELINANPQGDPQEGYPLEIQVHEMLHAAPANLFTGEASTFENLYKCFYEARRDVNRDVKNLGEAPKPLGNDVPDKAEAVALLEQLGKERRVLQDNQVRAESGVRERERLEVELQGYQERLETAGNPEEAQTEYKKVQEKIASLTAGQLVALARAESHQEDADKFASMSKKCPVSKTPVDCSMTKPKRDKLIAELTAIAEAALVEAGKIGTKIAPLQKRGAELAEDAKKPSKEGLEFQITRIEAELDKIPADGADRSADVEALTERISKGEAILADINRAERDQEVYAKQISKREKLEDEAEVLDALVKVLSPKGLPGKILSETIGPIETRANEKLQEMTGGRYQLHLQVDPDFLILVDHDGIRTDLDGLSTSEKWRVGLVLQDAIAQLSGLRFLLIDEADKLDPGNRVLFTEALLSMAPDYEQIIVFATIDTGGVHAPEIPIPDLGLYLLKDGQLEEVV